MSNFYYQLLTFYWVFVGDITVGCTHYLEGTLHRKWVNNHDQDDIGNL